MSAPVGTITVTLSVLVGLTAGYTIAHWRLSSIFAKRSDAEIEEMRQYYEDKYNPQPKEEVEKPDQPDMADSPLPEAVVDPLTKVDYSKIVQNQYTKENPRFIDRRGEILDEDDDEEETDPEEEDYQRQKPNASFEAVTSEVLALNEYDYDEMIYLTYHYHEDLLTDFWGYQVDRGEYIGNIVIPKPKNDTEVEELCVINHEKEALVEVSVSIDPLPDSVYGKNEAYIKRRWTELQEAGLRNRARKEQEEGGEA